MFKFLKSIIVLVLFITGIANAQVKLGHINSTQLLGFMPETKNADSSLQKFGSSLENQLKTMSAEYDSKVADFKSKEASMAEPIHQAKRSTTSITTTPRL